MTRTTDRPFRTALYIPGSRPRALDKATELACDAIIFDLEDAVAPAAKEEAREALCAALRQNDYGARFRLVRVNGLGTPWGRDDIAAFKDVPCDGLLIPKVSSVADLDAVVRVSPGHDLWAMMETVTGVLAAREIAGHPALRGMVMGTNDLQREIGSRHRADRLPLQTALGHCLLAARSRGRVILDGVYTAFEDEAGLRAECEQGRDMGFDGKTVIHPAQIATANEVFAPSEAEVDLARRQIAAYEAATAAGQGVAVLDGRIVENLHVEIARRLLDQVRAIATMMLNKTKE